MVNEMEVVNMKKLLIAFMIMSSLTALFHFMKPKENEIEVIQYDGWTASATSKDPQ